MNITKEEIEALHSYFDVTTINISSLIKKIGLSKVRTFEKFIDKIYKEKENAVSTISSD